MFNIFAASKLPRVMGCEWWWKWAMMITAWHMASGCSRFFNHCKYYDVTKTVNCSSINLRSLHAQAPSIDSLKVERLHLKSAGLTMLEPNVFNSVPKLWYLDLSNNFLEALDSSLFRQLTNLLYLDLTNNKLSSLHDDRLLKTQKRLVSLLLTNNKLTIIDLNVISPLKSIRVLKLTGNPFVCDCKLRQTMLWCAERDLDTNATCKHPHVTFGSPWSVLNVSETCEPTHWTKVTPASETNTTLDGNKEVTATRSKAGGDSEVSTEDNSEASITSAGPSVTMLILSVCVATLLIGLCLVSSVYCWRKLKASERSEIDPSGKYQQSSSEYNESPQPCEQSMIPLSLQEDNPLQEGPSMSVEVELLQSEHPAIDIKETRL